MKEKKYFDERDVELLETVLNLVPDLDIVAYAGKLARDKIKYPIRNHSGLRPLFGNRSVGSFKGRKITFEQAQRFVPDVFFPIKSERDLLCKLMIAFQRGRLFHLQEAARQRDALTFDSQRKFTILPSPALATLATLT